MKFSLSFENFRKFKQLQALNCSDITFLVGPNGSGKSSFTKAMLLAISNLNNLVAEDFATLYLMKSRCCCSWERRQWIRSHT